MSCPNCESIDFSEDPSFVCKDQSDVEVWGDSLVTNMNSGNNLGIVTGYPTTYNGFGGQTSTTIAANYAASSSPNNSNTKVFWMATNDPAGSSSGWSNASLTAFASVVSNTPSGDYFLVGPVPNANWTQAQMDEMKSLEEQLRDLYGPRFINVRALMVANFDRCIAELTASYVQPSIGANVTMSFDTTSNLVVGDEFYVGGLNIASLYEVVSISGNNAIMELVSIVDIPVGDSVSSGCSMTQLEYQLFLECKVPDGLRYDNVHLITSQVGYGMATREIDRIMDLYRC